MKFSKFCSFFPAEFLRHLAPSGVEKKATYAADFGLASNNTKFYLGYLTNYLNFYIYI